MPALFETGWEPILFLIVFSLPSIHCMCTTYSNPTLRALPFLGLTKMLGAKGNPNEQNRVSVYIVNNVFRVHTKKTFPLLIIQRWSRAKIA